MAPGLFSPPRGEVLAMRSVQCWALLPDGTRCSGPSIHGNYFCAEHRLGHQPDPALIFLAPAAEMPNDLVQYLRAVVPDIPFPVRATTPPERPSPASPQAARNWRLRCSR